MWANATIRLVAANYAETRTKQQMLSCSLQLFLQALDVHEPGSCAVEVCSEYLMAHLLRSNATTATTWSPAMVQKEQKVQIHLLSAQKVPAASNFNCKMSSKIAEELPGIVPCRYTILLCPSTHAISYAHCPAALMGEKERILTSSAKLFRMRQHGCAHFEPV